MKRAGARGARNFNPHHHAGGDFGRGLEGSADMDFNPHHHAGGD